MCATASGAESATPNPVRWRLLQVGLLLRPGDATASGGGRDSSLAWEAHEAREVGALEEIDATGVSMADAPGIGCLN